MSRFICKIYSPSVLLMGDSTWQKIKKKLPRRQGKPPYVICSSRRTFIGNARQRACRFMDAHATSADDASNAAWLSFGWLEFCFGLIRA
jgi:hypothetical protein